MKDIVLKNCTKGIMKMKTLIKNIEFELKYLKYKNIFWILILFFIAINILTLYMENQFVSTSYNEYKFAQEYYKENPDEIEDDGSYEITQNDDGSMTVSNPLQYHFEQVSKSLFVVSPQYCVAQVLEMSFVLLPLLFCILGVFLANYDKNNGVYKHKILRFGRESYYLTKLIIGMGLIIAGVIVTAFLGKILNVPFYRHICNTYPVDEFELGNAEMLSNDFTKIIIVIVICLVLYSLSFVLALFTNNSTIPLLFVVLYNYVAPAKFAYGIKNCYRALLIDKFDFYGIVSISDVKSVNLNFAILLLVGITLISQFFSYLMIKKRSAYI